MHHHKVQLGTLVLQVVKELKVLKGHKALKEEEVQQVLRVP